MRVSLSGVAGVCAALLLERVLARQMNDPGTASPVLDLVFVVQPQPSAANAAGPASSPSPGAASSLTPVYLRRALRTPRRGGGRAENREKEKPDFSPRRVRDWLFEWEVLLAEEEALKELPYLTPAQRQQLEEGEARLRELFAIFEKSQQQTGVSVREEEKQVVMLPLQAYEVYAEMREEVNALEEGPVPERLSAKAVFDLAFAALRKKHLRTRMQRLAAFFADKEIGRLSPPPAPPLKNQAQLDRLLHEGLKDTNPHWLREAEVQSLTEAQRQDTVAILQKLQTDTRRELVDALLVEAQRLAERRDDRGREASPLTTTGGEGSAKKAGGEDASAASPGKKASDEGAVAFVRKEAERLGEEGKAVLAVLDQTADGREDPEDSDDTWEAPLSRKDAAPEANSRAADQDAQLERRREADLLKELLISESTNSFTEE